MTGLIALLVTGWAVYGMFRPEKALSFVKAEDQRKRSTVAVAWFISVFALGFIAGYEEEGTSEGASEEEVAEVSGEEEPDGIELRYHIVREGDYGRRNVVGVIENHTERSCGYTQVTFNLYDKSGNRVGTAMDNIADLGPRERWSFEAAILEDRAARHELGKVSSSCDWFD